MKRLMDEETMKSAAVMWRDGQRSADIASSFGLTTKQMMHVCENNRPLFPYRNFRSRTAKLEVVHDSTQSQRLDPAGLRIAAGLWARGSSIQHIAEQLGVTYYRVSREAQLDPNLFPSRGSTSNKFGYKVGEIEADAIRWARSIPANCMRWTTESGAVVTLPRISLISCPRSV